MFRLRNLAQDAAILVLSMMGQEGREARGEVSGEAG